MFVQQKSKVLRLMQQYLEREIPYVSMTELAEGLCMEFGIRSVVIGFVKDTITVYEYEGELQMSATDFIWNTPTGIDDALYQCIKSFERYKMTVN